MGSLIDREYPNVLRLSIPCSSFDRTVISLLNRLPLAVKALAQSVVPYYFLPSRIVIKTLKPDWDDEFNNEKHMYERLQPLQGILIPQFFGETECQGTRALILSEVDGVEVCKQKPPFLEPAEFRRRVEAAFDELAKFGLGYGHLRLDNFLIVGDGIVVLDLESVYEAVPDELEYATRRLVKLLTGMYEDYLEGISDDR